MHRFLLTCLMASVLHATASSAEFTGVKVAPYLGYENAVHLSNGRVTAVLCPEVGGRVLEYALNGNNALYLSDGEKKWKPGDRPESSAGRFDVGPELIIPPRPTLWNGAWTTEIIADRHARLTSPDDASTGVRLVRDFVLDEKSTQLSCTQTIHNISEKPVEWCHWSRTFAVGRGICLIPLTAPSRFPKSYVMYEEGSLINMNPDDPNIRVRDGFLEIFGTPRKPKLGMDSYAGLIAYLSPNSLLFVKRFKTYPDRVYNEAAGLTISIWYPDNAMIELEPIGPRERLQPREHASFTEEWFLTDMPFPESREVDLESVRNSLTAQEKGDAITRFVDCSLLIAPEYPATWPTHPFPRFQLIHEQSIGPNSPYNIDVLLIDGNTGTQLDVPPHSVVRPELNREKSGPFGLAYTDRIEAWQFGGEACIVDVRELLDQSPNGVSPLVLPSHIERFEMQHRKLKPGDVVLFRSDYSDTYYRPFPEGQRYIADVVDRKSPGYPDPNPETMEFLATRGVMTLGTDSASMGPMPNLAEPTHYAGLRHGMIWTEGATNLGQLPATGAFYCMLGPKHADGPYSETRAFAVVGGGLPARLIESARNKRAIDLSPTLATNLPVTNPGSLAGRHRQVYVKVDFLYSPDLDMWHHTHLMDATAGTHLVTPSFALPPEGAAVEYSPEVRGWLAEYESRYGQRGFSSRTTDEVPLDWTCGDVRVVDVRSLVGTTQKSAWPASPEITVSLLQADEAAHGQFERDQIILFYTGHLDQHFKPAPDDKGVWQDPLSGKSEGWPAPGPDAINYLHSKRIRCVATDAPDLGGVDPRSALMTYWALGGHDMVGVEFLNNVGSVPKSAYFLFAPTRIRDCHASPGRAIVLY